LERTLSSDKKTIKKVSNHKVTRDFSIISFTLLLVRRQGRLNYRQVSWLTDQNVRSAFQESPRGYTSCSPFTVAGPRRIYTDFPILLIE